MKTAVVQFPGSNCDLDVFHVLKDILKVETDLIWHEDLAGREYDSIILPGGFSYGDYLRAGTIAAHSPAMEHVRTMAEEGRPVLGICNGFQILIESGLLPGALLRNECLTFVCKWVKVRVETSDTVFTRNIPKGTVLNMPIAHAEGRYVNEPEDLEQLDENGQIVFRYISEQSILSEDSNPNGSMDFIAGICNEDGNVVGLMPHPERAAEPILSPFFDSDGLRILAALKG